ncbi:hypothetical protein ACQEVF_59600 [Nonomuraea polychroma]|uniref:hypothetical protein n=1 Tax=Nonomuraea polychroma TaxID=46176 RepID=UPI003D8AEBDD
MNASARKELPAPDPLDLGEAMRRRYQTGPAPEPTEAAEAQTDDDATTSRSDKGATSRSRDATEARRHDVTKPRSREGMKPRRRDAPPPRSESPSVEDSVALTVRFAPEAYEDIDDWVRDLRRELGWRKLDKSLVVRKLLEVAQARADVRKALLQALVK